MKESTIIEKIRKLLALSEGAGTQAEAEAALAKAKELMLRHSLSMAEVATEREPVAETERRLGKVRCPKWQIELSAVIAQHFFCSSMSVRGPYRAVVFVGMGRDSEVAAFVFDYACHAIAKLLHGHRDRSSFAKGCVLGFHLKLKTVFPKGVNRESVNALVLAKSAAVVEYVRRETQGRKTHGLFHKPKDDRAFHDGIRSGYALPLHMPVESGETSPVALEAAS